MPFAKWGGVGFVIICGLLLRFFVAAEPLWLDELHTAWCVGGDWDKVLSSSQIGNQPPLYFWCVWLIENLLGPGVFSLRFLSLLSGGALLIAGVSIVFRVTKSVLAATLIAFLISFDTSLVFYATEARPYGVIQILGLLQGLLFWWSLRIFSWRKAIALVLLSAILFWVHYTSATLFVAEAMFLCGAAFLKPDLVFSGEKRSTTIWRWGLIGILVVTACAPAAWHLFALLEQKDNWESVSSVSQLGGEFFLRVLLCVVPALLLTLIGSSRHRKSGGQHSAFMVFLCFWAVVPNLLILSLAAFEIAPLALERYVQVSAIAFPLLIAVAIGGWNGSEGIATPFVRKFQIVCCGLVLIAAVSSNPLLWRPLVRGEIPALRFENWEPLVEAIHSNPSPAGLELGERIPVFLFANVLEDRAAQTNRDETFQRYLLFPITGMYPIDESRFELIAGPTLSNTPFSAAQIAAVNSRQRAFLIIRAELDDAAFIVNCLIPNVPATARLERFSSPHNQVVLISVAWD